MNNIETNMREWLKECYTSEDCHAEIDECNFMQLKRAVNKEYHGGFEQFVKDGCYSWVVVT